MSVEKGSKRRAFLRWLRGAAIGTAIVFVLLVGAGVAYTWYMGMQPAPTPEVVEDTTTTRPATVVARKMAPDAVVGVSKQMITSPVLPGENVSLTVKTNPEATCSIVVTYGKKGETEKQSTDSGLRDKVASEYGMVTWAWTVEADRPLGEWPVDVTCANEANSGALTVKLVLGEAEEE